MKRIISIHSNKAHKMRYFITLFVFMYTTFTFAHDIEVANSDGKTIYYNYNSDGSSVYVTYQGTSYSSYSDEYSGEIVIPKNITSGGKTYSVTNIGSSAFEGCSGLTSVIIPESVTSFGNNTFEGCSRLTSVTWNVKNFPDFSVISDPFYNIRTQITEFIIGDEVISIPAHICSGMSNLKSIDIPNSVTSIGDYAFQNCSGMISATIGCSVTCIGNYSFYGCSGLKKVTIGNSVTSIGENAFMKCSGLTSLIIPESVTSIGDWAFYGCSSITSIKWNAKNCASFSNWLYQPFYSLKTQITEFIIGNEVTSIPSHLCDGMSKLSSITIPGSVTSIGDSSFKECSSLTSVNIPNSVTSIGYRAFEGCSGLTSITIGNSVTSIGHYAFLMCNALTDVTSLNMVPPIMIHDSAFSKYNATLHIPKGSVGEYSTAPYWEKFFNIIEDANNNTLIVGDVNNDGSITMADANAVVNYFLTPDKSNIVNFNVQVADVNGDGYITMADANAIVNMFLTKNE